MSGKLVAASRWAADHIEMIGDRASGGYHDLLGRRIEGGGGPAANRSPSVRE